MKITSIIAAAQLALILSPVLSADDKKFVMKGYQCDLHPKAPYLAMIYGEKERGIIKK